jgi:hypothetical protein
VEIAGSINIVPASAMVPPVFLAEIEPFDDSTTKEGITEAYEQGRHVT